VPADPATNTAANRLRITEIFYSLQGESLTSGCPTVFIRLTGCPLRCGYCDTDYAFQGGEWMDLPQILERVAAWASRYVTVTGGEPLAQRNCISLLRALCDAGYAVSLETSGALPLEAVDPRVVKVMDLKTPGSGEAEKNRFENLAALGPDDQIKFVICDRRDYEWARELIADRQLDSLCELLLSPSHDQQDPTQLAEWILEDRLRVRLQLQLHKQLWGNERGR
jgi:7-carboxy-7-deazaguanine synthase